MPLAPASSRGAFLKARFAVNGIQCAARSFGTLTLGAAGLLSSMGASLSIGAGRLGPKLSASAREVNRQSLALFRLNSADCCVASAHDPEKCVAVFRKIM